MTRLITTGWLLLLLVGCSMPLRTDSTVKVNGCLKGDMDVRMQGQMEARVRTEQAPVVDPGPLLEVPVPPVAPQYSCKIAVLDIDGILANLNNVGPFSLGENPVAMFKEKLDVCAADPNVRAVVLRINTPGGGVAATDLMWHELKRFRQATGKPVVACLLDVATGGGYFLATACDSIIAIPSSVVGGIGVLLNIWDGKDSQNQSQIFSEPIRAGEKIDMGTITRKLTEEEEKLLQKMANGYHDRFRQVVQQARPRVTAKSEVFDGRILSSAEAESVGLIDQIGYLDDALAQACRLAQIDTAQAIMYRRAGDSARTLYATTPNRPLLAGGLLGVNIPGLDRTKLPLFLYLWQPEPTLMKLAGY